MPTETRRILEIKPGQTWLVIADGRWAFDAPPNHSAVPLDTAAAWLLPLVERPRHEVESAALARLGPEDPDLAEPVHIVIGKGLSAWSDHWISRALDWVTADEAEFFSGQLQAIATGQTSAAQPTQHAAKELLKQQRLWGPLHHESA